MSRTVVVDVTAEDIAAGKPKSCMRCPIALALRRATPGPCVYVSESTIASGAWTTLFPPEDARVEMPGEASDFVSLFDDGKEVRPFTFTVELP